MSNGTEKTLSSLRSNTNFQITEDCEIKWHSIGGVERFRKPALPYLVIVESFRPDIVILQLGSNDLMRHRTDRNKLRSFVLPSYLRSAMICYVV